MVGKTRYIEEHFRNKLPNRSLDGAGELLAETAAAMGWNRVAFHGDTRIWTLPLDSRGQYLARRMGWPADYLTEWSRREAGKACPVARRCEQVATPFTWDSTSASWRAFRLQPRQKAVLDFYRECADTAITVPAHRPGAKTGYVTWFSRSRRTFRQLFPEHYSALYLISHQFIQHLDALREADLCEGRPAETLTSREQECLAWAARGKTEEEIGIIIGRSQATARFHLRNAMHKLNACNRTHAVAKACSRGLIPPL